MKSFPMHFSKRSTLQAILWLAWFAGLLNLFAFKIPAMLSSEHDWTKHYGITEWLINYQAGFVRRGIAGEMLHGLWVSTGVDPIRLILFMCSAMYAAYSAYMYIGSRGKSAALLLPSAMLIGFPLYSNDVVRKDILLILFIAVMAHYIPRIQKPLTRLIVVNLFLCMGMLIHEMFMFMAFPLSVYLVSMGNADTKGEIKSWRAMNFSSYAWKFLRTVLRLAPSIFLFAYLAFITASGNPESALVVHNSWKELWTSEILTFPVEPGGSIMWLSASAGNTLKMVVSNHLTRYFYIPSFAWTVFFALIYAVISVQWMSKDFSGSFAKWLVIQAISIGPLFVVAIDSGRWVFLIFSTSFIIAIEGLVVNSMSLFLPLDFIDRISSFILRLADALSTKRLPVSWLLVFTGYALSVWTPMGAVLCSPLYQLWLLFRNLGLTPSMKWIIGG